MKNCKASYLIQSMYFYIHVMHRRGRKTGNAFTLEGEGGRGVENERSHNKQEHVSETSLLLRKKL